MSTLTSLPQPGDIGSVVATELRVLMARHSQTQAALAVVLGISQSQMSKRMNGVIPFDIIELDALARHFGVGVAELVGGQQNAPRPGGPDGGQGLGRARQDSNLQPSDPKVRGSVIELFPAA